MRTGRNEPCPCGSGKKYKACCLGHHQAADTFGQKLLMWVVLGILGIGLIVGVSRFLHYDDSYIQEPPKEAGKVWSEEHQHWH